MNALVVAAAANRDIVAMSCRDSGRWGWGVGVSTEEQRAGVLVGQSVAMLSGC